MNFSEKKLIRVISMVLVLVMMTTLFAGCKKDPVTPETTEGKLDLNINLEPENETPTETTEPAPVETEPPVNEKSATVLSQINVRNLPTTSNDEKTHVTTLYAGDKVIVERQETVTGLVWGYISSPVTGWICMDFVEMDVPNAQQNNNSTPAGSDPDNQGNTSTDNQTANTTSTKGVVTTGLNIRKEPNTTSAVVGAYTKGDVVTITETKNGWGKTSKGWIKLDYVNTTGNTTTGNNNTTTNNANTTGNGNKNVQFKGVVRANELNIRASASQSGDRLGSYTYGTRVEFYEKSGNWGRTEKGWISLDYVYQDGTTGTKTATGTVTGNGLNIRSGPGKNYASVGSLNKGDKVSILEQFTYNGTTWGCTKSGWISMDYVDVTSGTSPDKNNATNNNSSEDSDNIPATVTANGLNIRSGPGKGYDVVGSLDKGDRVMIQTRQTVNGVVWAKISQGWISMDYVKVN